MTASKFEFGNLRNLINCLENLLQKQITYVEKNVR